MDFLVLACLLFWGGNQQIPESDCGTLLSASDLAAIDQRVKDGLFEPRSWFGFESQAIYVKAHVIQEDNGSNGMTATQVQDAINDANLLFDQVGFAFELIDEIVFINDSNLTDLSNADIQTIHSTVAPQVDYAVNVYFAANLGACGQATLNVDQNGLAWIKMNNSCATSFFTYTTIGHEFGHFFGLLHTHETFAGQECVDGSNCSAAGDFICDTPADPNLIDSVTTFPTCSFIPNDSHAEPCGGFQWTPDTTNVMSYAFTEFGDRRCRTFFSEQQISVMRSSLSSFRANVSDLEPRPCCLPGEECELLGSVSCNLAGGLYADESGQDCTVACSRGSCCFENGFCFPQVEQDSCEAQGGAFYGSGVTCPPLPCDSTDLGTCCLLDGTCGSVLPADCVSNGGDWLGFGSACADSPCESLDVACCFSTQCLELPADSCLASGGSLEAIGGCSDSVCELKACCLTGGVCVDLLRSTCVASGGSLESNAACDTTQCQAPSCPGDVDGDGQVAFGDLLATLSVWGPCVDCPEDFDGDDAVTFDDLIGLLSVWGDC